MTWLKTHTRLLSYLLGSTFVTAWTVLRFFTQRTIFDLVGQQVLAGQWLHGGVAGASIGVTNYIPKIFVLYMPLFILPGSPRLKLILLTIAVNVATLILLGLIAERILRDYGIRAGGALNTAIIWLGAIAGSVFWIEFTNSRNLEVVGGLLLVYWGLRYLRRPTQQQLLVIGLFGVLLFFADTLQFYMTALPLVVYGLITPGAQRQKRVGWLVLSVLVAFVGSKLLFATMSHLFSLHFLAADNSTGLSLQTLPHAAINSLKAFVHLYAGGADAGKLREVANLLFIAIVVVAVIYGIRQKLMPRRLLLLVGLMLVINEVVYVASGQAGHVATERYLIMTAPALVLLFGALQKVWLRFRRPSLIITALFVLINVLSLGRAVIQANQHRFLPDTHLASVERYLRAQPAGTDVYASMDSSLPVAYLSGSSARAPLPLTCAATLLHKSTTFYSKTTYQTREAKPHDKLAIILDGGAITNVPSVCTQTIITSQLGQPQSVQTTDDGSLVLIYTSGAPVHTISFN